ncbi:hypothetical protein M8494_11240 [Serratia ureilytica]
MIGSPRRTSRVSGGRRLGVENSRSWCPPRGRELAAGVASGKYDATVYNITVTNERKTKFDFATYRGYAGFRQIRR